MPTERDYYEVLGVARDADDATIKKAFRRLARQLHPDVSTEPDAELRFREVTEAYEVLASSETRALYDRYGHAGLRSGGFRPTQFDVGGLADIFSAFFGDELFSAGTRRRGADVGATVEIELAEAARGVTVTVPFEVAVPCATCGGDGVELRPAEGLGGLDVGPPGLEGERRAGLHGDAVEVNDAGPALRRVAADMRAGQPQVLAQELDQERSGVDIGGDGFSVHRHRNGWHGIPLLTNPGLTARFPTPDCFPAFKTARN